MSDLRTDAPRVRRDLAAVVRFVDAFTGLPVRVPMTVSIPLRRWVALYRDADATYRFSLANLPTGSGAPHWPAWVVGTHDLRLDVPGAEYGAPEPRQVTVPAGLPLASPSPADYLTELKLWPTRALRAPPGETAVVGRLVSTGGAAVAGLKVTLFQGPAPPAATPYTYADAAGEFLFRLPGLRRGATPGPTETLSVEVRNAGGGVVLATTVAVAVGGVSPLMTFTLP